MALKLVYARPLDFRSGDSRRPFLVSAETRRGSGSYREVAVTADEHRIAGQYEAAHKRALAAAAARREFQPMPAEPAIDAIEPQDRLTPRQEAFCQHYAAQPVATRAAMMAGYSERSAGSRGWKLLRHPLVLDRIAQLRAQRNLRYRLERDTLHDKLEAVFFEALDGGSHAAAVAALKLQATLGGLLERRTSPAAPRASASPAARLTARPATSADLAGVPPDRRDAAMPEGEKKQVAG